MSDSDFRELFAPERSKSFDHVAISVAAPETIRHWSRGEVENPETVNFRTFKPEKDGLFCERIFGPIRDWECSCGKYKRIRHKGVVCDRCGVEVTLSRVRRERMGHIELVAPVSHIWFFKNIPSRIGLMLNMSSRELERVIYYEDFVVIDPGNTPLQRCQLLTENEHREALDYYGDDRFTAGMGAEGIKLLLSQIDLAELSKELEEAMGTTRSKQIRKKLNKRLKLVQGFISSRSRPEWMILDVIPVIPPDLRPMVPLEGGRYATSDLNDLYRRVINRNNRIKSLLQIKTAEVIIRNEKRMLQEAVDALFDNGRHGCAVSGAGNRPLKSLSDMLKGKNGQFRQNLLGKCVDYSGRSVIVPGPELKLHQCGLPKRMALVLFEPFVVRRLKELGYVHTVRSAKKMIERETPEVWDILEEITKSHPVLLNRAPTLHRLSIQAFEPQLIEGQAIRIHPLVCTAYNADFDGDTMAVHVPLSVEAQMEARMFMMASKNLFSPSSGKPITAPSHDIALGCYYLTQNPHKAGDAERLPLFATVAEVEFALAESKFHVTDRIRYVNPDFGRVTHCGNREAKVIETTIGRVIFNAIWPDNIGFLNEGVGKNQISDIIGRCYRVTGQAKTVETLERLKDLGFAWATRAGISISIDDLIVPPEKQVEVERAYQEAAVVEKQYRNGIITDGERHNRAIDIWTSAGERICDALLRELRHNRGRKDPNPLYVMLDSGARCTRQQVKQLAGIRGLIAKPSGEIVERPITSNFREGLSMSDYFISAHGARKGLADTALKTAVAGYLSRKLVDCAQDVIVTEADCGTLDGIIVRSIYDGDEEVVDLGRRIVGRVSCETIIDPGSNAKLVVPNQFIDELSADQVVKSGVEQLKIRSVLTCEAKRGVCARCYGRNLATGLPVQLGEAVGIIAAQSIGEPGMQLTMRTFQVGGAATQMIKEPVITAKNDGAVHFNDLRVVQSVDGTWIVLNKNGSITVEGIDGRELERYNILIGSVIAIADGQTIKKGQTLVHWDPYSVPIISSCGGKIAFRNIVEGVTVRRKTDPVTGLVSLIAVSRNNDRQPQITVSNGSGEIRGAYRIPDGAHIVVQDADLVTAGQTLAKIPLQVRKTRDITTGLPRVIELFEARHPKDAAEIAKSEGIVEIGGAVRGKRRLLLKDLMTGIEEEHLIPLSKHIIVFNGDLVRHGQKLTDGPVASHEILDNCGQPELQEHLVNEVQEVYRLQGVEIADKHIEIILRQMLRKVTITDPGDTALPWGGQVDKLEFEAENRIVIEKGGNPAEASPLLLGITKASLGSDSFISAASFQDTIRVLTEAATLGRIDYLRGLKENVIMGHLIPAGTGFPSNRDIRVISNGEIMPEDMEPISEIEPILA